MSGGVTLKILVCIDDTDNMESPGTGHLASSLAEAVERFGWGQSLPVTRHQLFVHPDIPYTSHNSAMCFGAEIDEKRLDSLIAHASDYLTLESAPGSDPGLCVACFDRITEPEKLIRFGQRAKSEILAKEEAYELAHFQGIHLSEHGGTGQGVIGALAGAGLRLSGNDGRLKGKLKIRCENNTATVGEILAQTVVDTVMSLGGAVLREDEPIYVADWVKAVLKDGKYILPVYFSDGKYSQGINWSTCTKQQLRDY